MPIHGLTGDARWPRIGSLHKGGAKPNEKQPGRDLGERLRFVAAGEDAGIAADWAETFGGSEVEQLTVRMPYASVDENWQAYREHWVAGGLVYRCDGREHVLWRDDAGEYRTDAVPCPGNGRCEAKAVGRLEVICMDLARLGTVTVLTTSINDIRNIDGCLRALALTVGDLSRIPMLLKRVPRDISTPGTNGKRQRRRTHLLHLEAAPDWVRAIRDGRAAVAALTADDVAALPPPVEADMATGEIIDADPVEAAPNGNGNGRPGGWTDKIARCEDFECLHKLHPLIEGVEPAPYRDNVMQLWYARWVTLARRTMVSASKEGLDLIARKLEAIPDGVAGKAEALRELEDLMWTADEVDVAVQAELV